MKTTTMQMNNGHTIPILSFGMYKVDSEEVVLNAIEAGYRHFDSATSYCNEQLLGNALSKAISSKQYQRSDFFITSKIWTDAQRNGPDAVRQSCVLVAHSDERFWIFDWSKKINLWQVRNLKI